MAQVFSDFNGTQVRNVSFLVYLKDWDMTYGELLDFLCEFGMECACSPIHDQDTWSAHQVNVWITDHTIDGKIDPDVLARGLPEEAQHKKEHVHVIIKGDGPRSAQWWHDELLRTGFPHEITYFKKVRTMSSALRYLAHMDNPEKHQYSMLDIHGFGGIDMSCLLKSSDVDKVYTLVNVMETIFERHIHQYHFLVKYAMSTGDLDMIACVTGRASMFAHYFKSESDEFRIKKKWKALMEKHDDLTMEELEKVFMTY